MKKLLFPLLLLVLIVPTNCRKAEIGHAADCTYTPTPNHPKAAAYQAVLDLYVSKGLPGISALIRDQNGTWVGSAGKADISENIDMKPCTVAKGASLTKCFMGALTMRLVEEGKLSLDDPLSKYISAKVIDRVKNARESTVRMLLNHTTGIYDVIDDNGFYLAVLNQPDRKWKPDDLLEFVYDKDPEFAPGTDVTYSNTNFLLLAMVIDQATGQNHATLLHDLILEPLHLDNTFYYWHDQLPAYTAQGYFDLYNNGTIVNITNFNTGSGNGYTGLYSNVFDLQVFIEALVRNKTLLQPATLAQMQTVTAEVDGKNRKNGLGIFMDFLERPADQFAWGHRGRDLGYSADMYWFPQQDYTMVYLVNYGTDGESSLRQTFLDFRTAMVDAMMQQ